MKRIGLVAAYSKEEAATLAIEINAWLVARGCSVVPETDLKQIERGQVDAIVVLGGDGLMMRAANAFPDIPLLGINFGKVGFLAMVERRDWQPALTELLDGGFKIDEGATLEATIERAGVEIDQGWAINDVVIRSGVRMVELELYVDGHYVDTYPGDGMITATPRGSTAYCMAAGGPILTAGVRGFAIVPISCHSPIRIPLIVAESAKIELVVASRYEASLILDGRSTADLQYHDTIRLRRGVRSFRLVSLSTTNFYEAFRTKFNFRIRPDAIPSRQADPDSTETPPSVVE
jgi:NAD+ kinase